MDALLRRELRAIAADRLSGASQLASRAGRAILLWLGRSPRPSPAELRDVATAVLQAQPAMAPIIRIALECLRAARGNDTRVLTPRLRDVLRVTESGPREIARRFSRALPARRKSVLLTHSYSSTVARALTEARSRIARVLCSEGRPNYEGRRMARELAAAKLRTELMTDSALTEFVGLATLVVVGADAISDHGMRNKVGTSALVACALPQRVPVWVLADSTKFLPRALCHRGNDLSTIDGGSREVWPRHPARIRVLNPYFGWTRLRRGIRILTESGWTTPRDIRRFWSNFHVPSSWLRGFD